MNRLLTIVLLLFTAFPAFSKYQQYMVVSFAGCANCSNSLRAFSHNKSAFERTILLSDPSNVTKEQLVNIAVENFGVRFGGYLLDKTLYQKFTNGEIPKLPYFIITKDNQLVFKIRVDSLMANADLLDFFDKLPKKASSKQFSNARLNQIGGYCDLAVDGNIAAVKFFNKSDRLYLYDLSTSKLDSLFYSQNIPLLQSLILKSGDSLTNAASSIELYQQYSLPFNLYQFGKPIMANKKMLFSNNLLYVNVDKIDTMISPNWLQYLIEYDFNSKTSSFLPLKAWHDTLQRPKEFLNFDLDDYLYQKVDSLHWIASARYKRNRPENMSEIAFITFRLSPNGMLPIAATTFPYQLLSDFKNQLLLKDFYILQLNYKSNFLFFNESPQFYFKGAWKSLSAFGLKLKWILDADVLEQSNLIRMVATDQQNQTHLYYLDAATNQVLHKLKFKMSDYKSNAVLTQQHFYYLNKENKLIAVTFN